MYLIQNWSYGHDNYCQEITQSKKIFYIFIHTHMWMPIKLKMGTSINLPCAKIFNLINK